MEKWKKLEVNENYSVSDKGRVRNDNTGKILKPRRGTGYLSVHFTAHGPDYYIHRLVATAFIDNPDNLPQVNHKDENKHNNDVSNLEWCSSEYNVNYGTRNERSGLNNKSKRVVIIDGKRFESIKEAEIHFGFPKKSIMYPLRNGNKYYKGHTVSYAS